MSILTIQRRLREIGRIRAGDRTEGGAPRKLTTWRLTSPQRDVITQAAERWGGKASPWESPNGPQFQVVTETDTLAVIIPSDQSISGFYELWKAGGCERRCDGVTELLSEQACLCEPDPELRECRPTTRLNVMLPDLSDLGQWRVEAHGFYAATELAGVADLLALAQARFVPARLRLEQRAVKRPGQSIKRFSVPVIEMDVKLGDILASLGLGSSTMEPALGALGATAPSPAEMSDDEWAELTDLLGPDPDPERTMGEIESDVRRLYALMERAGLWLPNPAGTDALHLALRAKMSADHLGDLRKAGLISFAELTWTGARAAVRALSDE